MSTVSGSSNKKLCVKSNQNLLANAKKGRNLRYDSADSSDR